MAAVLVIVALACMFQASIGFGANLIAQPIVYQFDPGLVPGSVLVATASLSCLVLLRERDAVELRTIGVAVAGAVIGIGIGVLVVGLASETTLAIVISLCVLAMVGLTALGRALRRTRRNLFAAGVAGGFGSLTAGIGGPPMALMFASADGPETRSFLSGFFLVSSILTFVGLVLAGRFGRTELLDGLLLVPAAIVGFMMSNPLLPIVDRGATRPAILLVSGAAATILLLRTLLGT
jgi:uncharacterized membrane protein YfcA